MTSERPYNQLHPALQFIVFIAVTVGILIAGALLGFGLIWILYGTSTLNQVIQMNITDNAGLRALWILQLVSTTLPILIVPLVFAKWVVREPQAYLKANFNFVPVLLALIFFVMLFSSPVIEVLSNINQRLALPPSLKGIEDWMRNSEKSAEHATNLMLNMKNIGDLVVDLLLVGLLTAIAEEFMFRGALQTIFERWTLNPHTAIWITAALFSAFHMEFYGFLPRLMLGVLFGYFVYWSGSIWTSVWAHFINNGTAVVITYLYQHKKISISPDDQHIFNYSGYVLSIVITVFLLYTYRTTALAGYKERNE